jgi:hypothetical protein
MQVCEPVQAMAHDPQYCGFCCVFTQLPAHIVEPAGQVHWPFAQRLLPVQMTPQLPQLLRSVCVFTHDPPQEVSPKHWATQLPAMQDSVD